MGLVDVLATMGVSNSQYWVYPLQTLVCGALVIVFWRHYRLAFPRGLLFTVTVALLVLAIWVSPQELFGFSHRYGDASSFNPTTFPPALWPTGGGLHSGFCASLSSCRSWKKSSGAGFCSAIL